MTARREFLNSALATLTLPLVACDSATRSAADEVVISGFELIPVRATERTVWLFLKLHTNAGLSGLGEASNAFGSANTTGDDIARMQAEVDRFLAMFENLSPLAVPLLRQRAKGLAAVDRVSATAFSAIEQAMWDLSGQLFEAPVWRLLGSKISNTLPAYANINRAVSPRTPVGFAELAARARRDGFKAVKAAPFDDFPSGGSTVEIAKHIDEGIESITAMREAAGSDVALMIDFHSFFTVEQAVDVANRLEPLNLAWIEEPVAPNLVDEALAIRERIGQSMAGGEVLFGLDGFGPLIERHPFDVIMPDVKHCGGLTEFMQIAARAAAAGIQVSPHNPSGPVSTAASIHVAACIENLSYLELQYGEVDWRGEILNPPERFIDGAIAVPDSPGFGITLDERAIADYQISPP